MLNCIRRHNAMPPAHRRAPLAVEDLFRRARLLGLYEGPAYIHNEVNVTDENKHLRRFSTLVTVDTHGASVAIVHDFAKRTPEGHAARCQVQVFTLEARRQGTRSFVDDARLLVASTTPSLSTAYPCAYSLESTARSTSSLRTAMHREVLAPVGTLA